MTKYNGKNRTIDCEPTLNDSQVLEFCKNGYLILENVVPNEINKKTIDYLNGKTPSNPEYIPDGLSEKDLDSIRHSNEPSTLILEKWFRENVIMNPILCGALRSLLGANFGIPVLISAHSVECPAAAQPWHHDADSVFGPELNYLENFYYPQDTPIEMGPTEILPGSHISHTTLDYKDSGTLAAVPAGSFVIHHQSIFHRRGKSTGKGKRHMLKYNYWRTSEPVSDWLEEPGFNPETADFGGHNVGRYYAHMFYWLSGKGDQYRIIGGQAWPWSIKNQIGPSYGFGSSKGYKPDWRKNNPDGYAN